ncbi:TPA: porin OmpC [Escherichia coli]|uniref:porin OmpC n=1 Tax=Escherichia coli TaxID=562 RepID=UPI000BE40181|nr:porin OmpC [Escherichia coli]EHL5742465.1 porin OmpC [Escherichia coli]EIK8036541.1 porin OmpC [Escherichia coli]EIY2756122.1 porin OmpC [Escherichia coli]EJD9551702.1 porin OmpC [Escherichia coli]EJD9575894.1 porin OmpC [Escherichia coli]
MKKMTVALSAVAAAVIFAAGAQAAEVYNKDGNKLDLYGRVTALHYFSSDKGNDGDQTYARLGFKGETQINDQLTGFGQWEYQFSGNKTESDGAAGNKTRLAFAGLKFGDFGSIDYGRNYGIAYDVGAYTDVLPEFGGDVWTQTDNFMTARTSGVATYRNTDFFGLVDGLNFAAQYQGKNERDDLQEANGDGYGFSASYEYEGFGIVAAYTNADRTNNQVKGLNGTQTVVDSGSVAKGKHAEMWGTGLKYDANNIYLATIYSETQNMTTFGDKGVADKAQNFEAVLQYQFDFGLRPSLAFLQSRAQDVIVGGKNYGNQDLVKYIDVGATYYFNKNMSTYVDYKINLIDESQFTQDAGVATDNIVAVGMTYQF